MTAGRVLRDGGLALVIAAAVCGCTVHPAPSPPTPSPPPQVVSQVPLPPPTERGGQVTVEGLARWTTPHPGCVALTTGTGQRFQLTGPAAVEGARRARTGGKPAVQQVRVTGYVAPTGASVCEAGRAFVAIDVEPS